MRLKNFINSIRRFINNMQRPSKQANLRGLGQRGEEINSFIIREARREDIADIAALHVKTWNQTYPHVRRPPTYAIRESQWQKMFSEKNDGSWFCYVLENSRQQLSGFATGKKYSHSDLPEFSGELSQIYLLSEYQRLGFGRKLAGYIARRFLKQDIHSLVLFGMSDNPSCAFHEAIGGKRLLAKNGEFHGGYGWKDIQQLALL